MTNKDDKPKYEYLVERHAAPSYDDGAKYLEEQDEKGWELVSVTHNPYVGYEYFFRRLIPLLPLLIVLVVGGWLLIR